VYDRYKYLADIVNVGIKLLNVETKANNSGYMENFVEHTGFFFRKVIYSHYDAALP